MKKRLVYVQLLLALGLFLAGYFAVPTQAVSSGAPGKDIDVITCCNDSGPVSVGNECNDGDMNCVVNGCPDETEKCKTLGGA